MLTVGNSDIEFFQQKYAWTLGNMEDSDIQPGPMVLIQTIFFSVPESLGFAYPPHLGASHWMVH